MFLLPRPAFLFAICLQFALPVAVLASPSGAPAVVQEDAEGQRVAEVFARVRTSDPAVLQAQLVLLGDDAVAELYMVLASGVLPDLGGGPPRGLRIEQRLAIRGALSGLSTRALRQALKRRALASPPVAERLLALELLGEVGSAQDTSLALRFTSPSGRTQPVDPSLKRALEPALRRILSRDPATTRELEGALERCHPALFAPLVRVLEGAPAAEALRAMAFMLGRAEHAEGLLLASISSVAPQAHQPVDLDVLDRVRGYLGSSDTGLELQAVLACGRLQDAGAVPGLIERLDRPALREGAHRALIEITGQKFPPRSSSWSAWYDGEQRWWRDFGLVHLGNLATVEPAAASQALMAASRRRLFRHEIAELIADGLRRPEKDLALLTCAVLGHLGSRRAVPYLIDALGDDRGEVAAAAARALESITGRELGKDALAWKKAELGGGE